MSQNKTKKGRKKRWLFGAVLLLIILFIASIFVKDSIRNQQIAAVTALEMKNKKFDFLTDSEFKKKLEAQDNFLVFMYQTKDNPGLDTVEEFLKKGAKVKGIDEPIYVYQPVYNSKAIWKEMELTEKNNMVSFKSGKMDTIFGFNTLDNGTKEINDAIYTILNPKIKQKEPVQNKSSKTEDDAEIIPETTESTTKDEKVDTQEITFE